jgi:hypothetical protein
MIKEACNSLAEQASDKTDRKFWLDLAHRWQGLLETGHRGVFQSRGYSKPQASAYNIYKTAKDSRCLAFFWFGRARSNLYTILRQLRLVKPTRASLIVL